MTRLEFFTKVLQIVQTRGRAFPTEDDAEAQNTLLNARLFAFTDRTRCLYSDEVTITLTLNVATYAMMSAFVLSGVTVPMLRIESFIVNTSEMTLLTLEELKKAAPTYKTDSASVPTCYTLIPGGSSGETLMRVYPEPVATHTDCPVSGWIGHPQIDTSTAGDETDVWIPRDHLETAAAYCAVGFLYPNQASSEDIQSMATLNQAAASSMRDLESRARDTLRGTQIRGYGVNRGESRNIQL